MGRRYRSTGPTPAVHPSSSLGRGEARSARDRADIYTASAASYGVCQLMAQDWHVTHQLAPARTGLDVEDELDEPGICCVALPCVPEGAWVVRVLPAVLGHWLAPILEAAHTAALPQTALDLAPWDLDAGIGRDDLSVVGMRERLIGRDVAVLLTEHVSSSLNVGRPGDAASTHGGLRFWVARPSAPPRFSLHFRRAPTRFSKLWLPPLATESR
jgi:hypothetical protein